MSWLEERKKVKERRGKKVGFGALSE